MYHFTTLMPLRPIHFMLLARCWLLARLQGGQPPVCFAHAVADYLVFDRVCSVPCIQDIANYEVQQFMEQVTDSSACNLIIGNCVYKDAIMPNVIVAIPTNNKKGG